MNTIPLLKENTDPTHTISSKLRHVTIHEGEATPGCTCDRWGHPCPDCCERKPHAAGNGRKILSVKK